MTTNSGVCDHPFRSREYYHEGVFKCWECKSIIVKQHSYSDPLPTETLSEVLAKAERASHNLEQQINKTNMTNEKTNRTDEIKEMNNNIQTNNTNATDENIPTWKKLYKSFVAMLIVFMFAYTGWNIIIWLYDTLGIDKIMPTLIGIMIWILTYDHMYGTASKTPRIK